MLRRPVTLLAVGLLTLSLSASALADEVKGTISKVGDEGREIMVKSKDGKEVNVKISGSRTKIDGVKGRSDLRRHVAITAV